MAKRRAELDHLFDVDIHKCVLAWLDDKFKIDVTNSGNHTPLKEAIQYFCRFYSPQDINKIGAKLLAKKSAFIVYLIDRYNILDNRIKRAILITASKRTNPPKPKVISSIPDSVLMVITPEDINTLPAVTLKGLLNNYAGNLNIKWEFTLEQIDKLLFPFVINEPIYAKSIRERLIIASKRGSSEEDMVDAAVLHYINQLDHTGLIKLVKDGFYGIDNWNYIKLEQYCDEHGLLSYGNTTTSTNKS